MWKEIFLDESDEELDRIAEITNVFSCWANSKSVVKDKKHILKFQLSNRKYPYRCFLYEDANFEILQDVRYRKDLDMWELMRFAIKWDTNDLSIDPFDAIHIWALKLKTFLQEVGKKIYTRSFRFDDVTSKMSKWYKPEIVDAYKDVGVNVFYRDEGKYWEWELM